MTTDVLTQETTPTPESTASTRRIANLTPARIDALGAELDALRQRVIDDLGERDATYIRRMIRTQRALEITGRGALFLSFLPPAWLAGVTALSVSKILDNMEIGHNIMHGQYDWMNDPALSSKRFEWDTASPSANWRNSHNFEHHTFTNIVGKDRDVGYGVLRMTEEEPWRPAHLANPINALFLAAFFQWGVALHDLEADRLVRREITWDKVRHRAKRIRKKALQQASKDYVLFPLLALPIAPLVFAGNATANFIRNVWAFMIIFCGHFPDGVEVFTEEETENESRGEWYVRQLLGSANIRGGKLFHIMSGNLSHQIEHHLFPDIPACRYAEMAPEVQAICARYGLRYNTAGLGRQFGTVVRRIFRLALPTPKRTRPASAQPATAAVTPAAESRAAA
ncbi:MAG: fatty acid desaturase family protein [Myxococcota bacterium]